MKTVALILARGGSKGIPNKNIIDLNGQPLLAYTINAAKKSQVEETWISTDSKKIKSIAIKLGANVITRPSALALDTSKSEEALLHFAKKIDFDLLVFIQPTSPLLKTEQINQGIKLMLNSNKYDSICSVYEEHWLPRWTPLGVPINWETNNRPRRQDKSVSYVENGALYITTKEKLLNSKLRYSGNIGFLKMKLSESFQIDTANDLELIKKIIS